MSVGKERHEIIKAFAAKGSTDVLHIAFSIRQSINGHSDPMQTEMLRDCVQYLKDRVRLWYKPEDAIDAHVRGICEQSISMGEIELAMREGKS